MKINLHIYDPESNKYLLDGEDILLKFIPQKEDKFVHQEKDGMNWVYLVDQVIYSKNNIEILLRRIMSVQDYHQKTGLHLF